jgi:hypothetical protein
MQEDFATRYTSMAFVLVAQFNAEFHDVTVTGRRPKLSVPESPSSEGGELVVQHISLVREGWPNVKIGTANCATNLCELRTWDYLADVHTKRYPGKRLPLDKRQYADFFVEAASFMRARGMQVTIVDAESNASRRGQRSSRSRTRATVNEAGRRRRLLLSLLAAGLVLLFAAGLTLALR